MKKIKALLLILIALLLLSGCDTSGCETFPTPTPTPTPEPTEPGVLLIGRFDQSNSSGPKASWGASTVKARFQGTAIGANLTSSGDNWFNVIVDGNVLPPVNITAYTAQPVTLASGLTSGTHTIEVVKRTEGNQGEMQFLGFTFPQGGSLLAPPKAAARRIEFIGDSITCGYGNEGTSQYQSFTAKNENAYLAYGSVTARLLEADQVTVACSGKGVIRNYGGDTNQMMPDLYPRTLTWNPNLLWDYTQWQPHVVVINLCTNDYSIGIPNRYQFTTAYADLVQEVRGQYAGAVIYCAVGPMLSGENLNSARDYISSVVNDMNSSGDTKVKFIEFPAQTGALGFGEDWHPSVRTHQLMADQLANRIRSDLGW